MHRKICIHCPFANIYVLSTYQCLLFLPLDVQSRVNAVCRLLVVMLLSHLWSSSTAMAFVLSYIFSFRTVSEFHATGLCRFCLFLAIIVMMPSANAHYDIIILCKCLYPIHKLFVHLLYFLIVSSMQRDYEKSGAQSSVLSSNVLCRECKYSISNYCW